MRACRTPGSCSIMGPLLGSQWARNRGRARTLACRCRHPATPPGVSPSAGRKYDPWKPFGVSCPPHARTCGRCLSGLRPDLGDRSAGRACAGHIRRHPARRDGHAGGSGDQQHAYCDDRRNRDVSLSAAAAGAIFNRVRAAAVPDEDGARGKGQCHRDPHVQCNAQRRHARRSRHGRRRRPDAADREHHARAHRGRPHDQEPAAQHA